jgi:hypothetical protein
MVVLPIESLTDFVTELTMSIIGNKSLQHAERAMILAVTWIAKRQDNLQK